MVQNKHFSWICHEENASAFHSCEKNQLFTQDKHIVFQKDPQENSQGSFQKPFSTEAFDDTLWLFEVKRARKAVQIVPVGGSKLMRSILVQKGVQICR